jgi:RHS repeat-associated protein
MQSQIAAVAAMLVLSAPAYAQTFTVFESEGINRRDACVAVKISDAAANECGDLRITNSLPATRTFGKARGPTLIYSSQMARPVPVIQVDISYGTTLPTSVEVYVERGNSVTDTLGRTIFSGSAWATNTTRRVGVALNVANDTTGLYYANVWVVSTWPDANTTRLYQTIRLPIVNRSNSHFGAGWWVAGLEEIFFGPYGQLVWVGGDGSIRLYYAVATNRYKAVDNFDRPDTITRNAGTGEYTRWGPAQLQVRFNSSGLHTSTTNRLGQVTTFGYHSGSRRLQSITLPVRFGGATLQYSFVYSTGSTPALSFITIPGPVGRNTVLCRSGAVVTCIQDPDETLVYFTYNTGVNSKVVQNSTDRRGFVTGFGFDGANRLNGSTLYLAGGAQISHAFVAPEGRALTTAQPLDSMYLSINGPRTDVTDVTKIWLNRFSAPTKIRNALGEETLLTYDTVWPALVSQVQQPNGFTTLAKYDVNANNSLRIGVNPYGTGANDTTRFEWDAKWSAIKKITRPLGEVVQFVYDATTGNLVRRMPGTDPSRRDSLTYDSESLLRSTLDPSGNSDSLFYDLLGNLSKTKSPRRAVTEFIGNGYGADTLVRTALDTTYSRWMNRRSRFDLMDRVILDSAFATGVSDTEQAITRTEFDAEGNPVRVTTRSNPDAAGLDSIMRIFTYDGANRATYEELAGGYSAIATTYDPAGNVLSGGRNGSATFTYDALNRVATQTADGVATFTYTNTGQLATAVNPFARVSRSYFPNGALKLDSIAVSVSDTSQNSFPFKYGIAHAYDLNGRRTSVTHPSHLAQGSGQVSYTYESVFGQLATVTDPFGNAYAHYYDAHGRLDSLRSIDASSSRITERRTYDADSRLFTRVVGRTGVSVRNDSILYDVRGKAIVNRSFSADYTSLGYLKSGGLGGGSEIFAPDAHGYIAGGIRAGSISYANEYNTRTGQLARTLASVPGAVDTTAFYYTGMGATGSRETHQYLSGVAPNIQKLWRTELMTYTSDNKLGKVFVDVDSQPQPTYSGYKPYRFEETYRYDALGRRIESRLWRTSNCMQKDPDSGCRNTLTRTIWDGAQVLFELRWAQGDTIPDGWSSDTAASNGDYVGTIGYVYGSAQTGELDHPLAMFKGTTLVLPHANWHGMIDQGTCPTSLCPSNDPRFPGVTASAYGMTSLADDKWYGTLINGMTDGSGLLFRRNRYVDPTTGRFTQEDPIGLAGGLNLYGFANGDPVTYSDPFGLCPEDMGGDGKSKTLSDCPKDSKGWNRYRSGAAESGGMTDVAFFFAGGAEVQGTKAAIKLASKIGQNKALSRIAASLEGGVQQSIDHLTSQLAKGNLNPGIGSRFLFNGIFEARARDGARVYFRNIGNESIEILAKSTKHTQDQVIRILRELYE